MTIDILIPQYLTIDCSIKCLKSIAKHTRDFRIILIDDGTPDKKGVEKVRSLLNSFRPSIHEFYMFNDNRGFGPTVHFGMSKVRSDLFVLMNNDVTVTPDWLTRLVTGINTNDKIAIISSVADTMSGICGHRAAGKHVGYDNKQDPERFFYNLPTIVYTIDNALETNHLIVPGFCSLMRKSIVWDELGGYDKRFLFRRGDGDMNDKVHAAGYLTAVCFNSFVYHKHGATINEMSKDVKNKRLVGDNKLWAQKREQRASLRKETEK